jgi:cbb3-type cytochrome oxidase subunit 3
MSTLGIIVIIVGAVLVLFFIGGLIGASRRRQHGEADYSRHLAEADRALEQARAADKGWDKPVLEAAAREALAAERPGWPYDELALVLVDDKPGVEEDRAHFLASGGDGEARVILARRNGGWALERVE